MKENLFHISEIFTSIQGEGDCAGINSLFVRFQYCNLNCIWCDSKFTWSNKEKIVSKTANELKKLILQFPAPHVIFTGGEPLLYPLEQLIVEEKKLHVETNGTIIPTENLQIKLTNGLSFEKEAMSLEEVKKFHWVVSPKLSNAKQEINDAAIHFWNQKTTCIFKLIIQNEADLEEIEKFVNFYQIDKKRIYIGLEGTSIESQLKPDLVDLIIEKSYNFSPRLHVLLWGNARKK